MGSMALSREEIQHLANLARIGLNDADLERFGPEFSAILDFVSRLQAADAKESMFEHASGAVNVMRVDTEAAEPLGRPEELKEDFISKDSRGNLSVPKIFE